jgi:hypothetical protein
MSRAQALAIATTIKTTRAFRMVSSVFRGGFLGSGRFVGILEPSMLASVIGGPRYRAGRRLAGGSSWGSRARMVMSVPTGFEFLQLIFAIRPKFPLFSGI